MLMQVPDVIADRYARIHHGYDNATDCSAWDVKPPPCQRGSEDGLSASATFNAVTSLLSLVCNPVVGSLSDARSRYLPTFIAGRKPFLLASLFLSLLPCVVFVVLLAIPTMDPVWYFLTNCGIGIVNYISILFAALSDIFPIDDEVESTIGSINNETGDDNEAVAEPTSKEYRAATFGICLAGFYGGYAVGPSVPVLLVKPLYVAIASLSFIVLALVVAIIFVPETRKGIHSPNTARSRSYPFRNNLESVPEGSEEEDNGDEDIIAEPLLDSPVAGQFANENSFDTDERLYCRTLLSRMSEWCCCRLVLRPFREMSVLNRNATIRLVTAASFFSSMVFASDVSLVIYYIEEQLQITRQDFAAMFFTFGIVGIALQAFSLQPLIHLLGGEKNALVLTFVCGTFHNMLYGIAKTKETIFFALLFSQLTKVNIPILSSLASKQASTDEQGRIQGALFATNAIGKT